MKDHLLDKLNKSRNYTLSVADLMPGDLYNFKPAEGVMNFKEQINHLAYGITWYEENYIKGNKTSWEPPKAVGVKKDLVAYLEKSYDSLLNTIKSLKIEDEIVNAFHATLDHITHHRAQVVVYLRCNGITPPEYDY